ncbi:DUF3800 domain-containing protein [Patescibacteria group bacterium]|nr:DUF3800 domain-containing protein [Patescibacteria group bacterium]
MFIGCDSSGYLQKDRYLTLGTVWISKEQLPKYEEAVCLFRLKNKLWGEIKWEKITPQKLKEYKLFLNISLADFSPEIKIILRDKKIRVPKGYFKNKGEMISTFYYMLISNHIGRKTQKTSFDILLDKENWINEQSLNLKGFLQFSFIKGNCGHLLNHLSQCDSKICSAIQLCDLVIGAVSAKLNQNRISNDKKEIIEHIEKILNHPFDKPTLPSAKKFNLWLWRPTINSSTPIT